jgi:hypothetical protein
MAQRGLEDGGAGLCRFGALISWAENLYAVTYLSMPNEGYGAGLYRLSMGYDPYNSTTAPGFIWQRIAIHNSCYANRMIHPGTDQAVIGPYVISSNGTIRTITPLLAYRIGAMALDTVPGGDVSTTVLMHGMDGYLWRVNLVTLQVTTLFDNLPEILGVPSYEQYHGKAAFGVPASPSGDKPLFFLGSNTEFEADQMRQVTGGRFASWDGTSLNASSWTIIREAPCVEINGRYNFGSVVFASLWDDRSAILMVLDRGDDSTHSYNDEWITYRLPKVPCLAAAGWALFRCCWCCFSFPPIAPPPTPPSRPTLLLLGCAERELVVARLADGVGAHSGGEHGAVPCGHPGRLLRDFSAGLERSDLGHRAAGPALAHHPGLYDLPRRDGPGRQRGGQHLRQRAHGRAVRVGAALHGRGVRGAVGQAAGLGGTLGL